MLGAWRFVIRHCRLRYCAGVGCIRTGHIYCIAIVMMGLNGHRRFCRTIMFQGPASRLHGGGYPLQG